MRLKIHLSHFVLLILFFASLGAQAKPCQLPSRWKRLTHEAPRVSITEGVYDERLFSSPKIPRNRDFYEFRYWVASRVNPGAHYLMREATDFFGRVNLQHLTSLFSTGQVGQVQRISCLDALLAAKHVQESPYQEVNTEFQAHVLLRMNRWGQMKYRIYFVSDDQSGSVSFPHWLAERISDDVVKKGWRVKYYIHLHPFNFKQNYGHGNLGALPVPSVQDIRASRFWESHSETPIPADEYRVTNGFHTGRFSSKEMWNISLPQPQWNRAPWRL